MKNREIVEKFAKRQLNNRCGKVIWQGSHIFCEDDVIYSYGKHFPLAKYLGEHPEYGSLFIKNCTKYSKSTSCHQGLINHYCNGPNLEFNIFEQFKPNFFSPYLKNERVKSDCEINGFSFQDLTIKNIYLWRTHIYKNLYKDKITGVYYTECIYSENGSIFADEYKLPKNVKFKSRKKSNYSGFEEGFIEIDDVLVLKLSKRYFAYTKGKLVKLKNKPKNISEVLNFCGII